MDTLTDENLRFFYERIDGCRTCSLKGYYSYCRHTCIPNKGYRQRFKMKGDKITEKYKLLVSGDTRDFNLIQKYVRRKMMR